MKKKLIKAAKKSLNFRAVSLIAMMLMFLAQMASAQKEHRLVRLAKLAIDPVHLKEYTTFLKEEIETSLRVEPGVLTLYAVSEKDRPDNITILEIYADSAAYKAHLQTPHFKKYKTVTSDMVKSLELVEAVPLLPGIVQMIQNK